MNAHQECLWIEILEAKEIGNITEMMKRISEFDECEVGQCRVCHLSHITYMRRENLFMADGMRF